MLAAAASLKSEDELYTVGNIILSYLIHPPHATLMNQMTPAAQTSTFERSQTYKMEEVLQFR